MRESFNPKLSRAIRLAAHSAFAVGVLAASAACSVDKILKVEDLDVATPGSLNTATALPILLGGAVANFHAAYIGTGNVNESSGQIGYSGLLADELRSSDTFPTRNQVDQRTITTDNSSNEAQFILLSQARAAAEIATVRFKQFGADQPGLALAYALDGYSTVLFGEDYCSGVPFSTLTDAGATIYGQPLTTAQIFTRAIAKFDSALAAPGITAQYKNLALVGKARAQLDLGQVAAAGATAAQVTSGFVFNIESSVTTSNQYNGIYTFNINTKRLTLVDSEGINGLDYLSANDPRITYKDTSSAAFDKTTNLIVQHKYAKRDAPAVLASYTEAQLIIAEAALASGNYATPTTGTLAILNTLRATVGLTPLAPAVGATAQQNQLFRERAFWFYLTAHRLGDLRRLVRQYNRTPESVFPTGPFFKGNNYGTDVNFPVPDVEKNNPNFHGCLDRNA
ncbi:MAG: hypothetical protein ACJ79K_16455 [Gemmatimonadaceae bacterium]